MPLIIFLILYIAWKCFFVASAETETKEGAMGCGCLLFFIIGGMFLLTLLMGLGM